MSTAKRPVNRQNWKAFPPPPSTEDLVFQTCSFDPRIGGPRVHSQLSPQFYNGIMGDKTLGWSLGERLRAAGQVLRDEAEPGASPKTGPVRPFRPLTPKPPKPFTP